MEPALPYSPQGPMFLPAPPPQLNIEGLYEIGWVGTLEEVEEFVKKLNAFLSFYLPLKFYTYYTHDPQKNINNCVATVKRIQNLPPDQLEALRQIVLNAMGEDKENTQILNFFHITFDGILDLDQDYLISLIARKQIGTIGTFLRLGVDFSFINACQLLHQAAKQNDVDAVRTLILCGANINLRDNIGNTPLYYSRILYGTNNYVTTLLLQAGARDFTALYQAFRYELNWNVDLNVFESRFKRLDELFQLLVNLSIIPAELMVRKDNLFDIVTTIKNLRKMNDDERYQLLLKHQENYTMLLKLSDNIFYLGVIFGPEHTFFFQYMRVTPMLYLVLTDQSLLEKYSSEHEVSSPEGMKPRIVLG